MCKVKFYKFHWNASFMSWAAFAKLRKILPKTFIIFFQSKQAMPGNSSLSFFVLPGSFLTQALLLLILLTEKYSSYLPLNLFGTYGLKNGLDCMLIFKFYSLSIIKELFLDLLTFLFLLSSFSFLSIISL